jgi:hypothetical protein
MQATAPTAPPLDLSPAPNADTADNEAPAPRERLAWGFPIGCGIVAAIAFFGARAIAPPVIPPEGSGGYGTSNFFVYDEPIGEGSALPMPFITLPIPSLSPPPAATNPRVSAGTLTVNGRLPPAVIQRILRVNQGRFRACYRSGLHTNPSLTGRVTARFVIGRDGGVSSVANGGSDLPDSSVVSCVVRALYGLSFPQPDAGIVTVVYPLHFTPG